MSRRIKKEGKYSGLREDGQPWPEILVGVGEIARYMRKHPETVGKWIRRGMLPAPKDTKGRRWTTKGIIERWLIETYKAELEVERAKRRIKPEARRNMIKDGVAPKLSERQGREQEGGKGSLLRCGAEAWQACPVNPDARHSLECYPICPYCMASDGQPHTKHCPAVRGKLAS